MNNVDFESDFQRLCSSYVDTNEKFQASCGSCKIRVHCLLRIRNILTFTQSIHNQHLVWCNQIRGSKLNMF